MYRAIVLASICASCGISQTCPASADPDGSALCVQLQFADGFLQVNADPNKTIFTPSDAFLGALTIPKAKAFAQLTKDINALFGKLPRLYWFGLTTAERDQDSKGALKSAATDELRHFKGSWEDFRAKAAAWHTENSQRLIDAGLLGQFLQAAQSPDLVWGAASYDSDEPLNPADVRAGRIPFGVADPISDWNKEEKYRVQVDDGAAGSLTKADIVSILGPLRGHLWRPTDIRELITEVVDRRGINVILEISPASDVPKVVHLRKAARIARVVFSPPVTDAKLSDTTDLDRVLYILLDARLFTKYCKDPQKFIKTSDTLQSLDLRDLSVTAGSEPFFNHRIFDPEAAELKQLGFTAGAAKSLARADSEGSFVDIAVQKESDKAAAQPKGTATKPAGSKVPRSPAAPAAGAPARPAAIPAGGAQDAPPAADQPAAPPAAPAAPSGPAVSSTSLPPPRTKKNYIGAGFQYNPGQGVTPILSFERLRLFGPGEIKLEGGANNGQGIGTGSFNQDYVAFGTLHRRMSLSGDGGLTSTINRLIGTLAADEARTGGKGRVEIEALRNQEGQQLLVYAQALRQTVTLSNSAGTVSKLNLSMGDIGATYTFARPGATLPWSLRIEPRVRHGFGLSASEQTFTTFDATGNWHKVSLGPFEFDVSGHVAAANGSTPSVELPSFGGLDSVRGFRRDDLLARRFWALQPELWTPIPGVGSLLSGPGAFLRRNARLAFFFDGGHVSQPLVGPAGFKGGAGVGLRFMQGPVVMQLDWAKAIGDAVTYAKWGRAYFNIRFN